MVSTVAGLAGAAGSAAILLLPGDFRFWTIFFIWAAAAMVLLGKYRGVELISIVMSAIVITALVFTASLVFPGIAEVAGGLIPGLPQNVDFSELLPWLGFMMSGAAGLVWYSYWLNERGFGAAGGTETHNLRPISERDKGRLKRWISVMAAATAIASLLVLILLLALMVLGTELLRPERLLPEGARVTAVLSRLLGAIWGPAGTWLMVLGSLFAFSSSLIGNVDGWSRMQSEGSVMITRPLNAGKAVSLGFYRYLYVIGLMGVVPTFFVLVKPEPLIFLILSGTIEAIHIPFVTLSILYINAKMLPDGLRPSPLMIILMLVAALFYIFFAFYYIHTFVS